MQAAAHLVEAVVYPGELGGMVDGDLDAELPVVNGGHALLQVLQGFDNPPIQQKHHKGGTHHHQHQKAALKQAQPGNIARVGLLHGGNQTVQTAEEGLQLFIGNRAVLPVGYLKSRADVLPPLLV